MYFKPRIFISSTIKDKSNLRKNIKNIFENAGAEVVLYEHDLTPSVISNTYRKDILQANFVIFIVDDIYGSFTEYNLSGTEEEFRIVQQNKIPCHLYLKNVPKTEEAEKFEKLIKRNGISYYFYKDEQELKKKLSSTCFTIAKDIVLAEIETQSLPNKTIDKMAKDADYKKALYWCKIFDEIFEIDKTDFKIINSNLLLQTLDLACYDNLNSKNIFIDKLLEKIFKDTFNATNNIVEYICNHSTPIGRGVNFKFPYEKNGINVSFLDWDINVDFDWLEEEAKKMYENYKCFRNYISTMRIEADLL